METRKLGSRQGNSIGTSLRGCVRDIVDRNHAIERVDRIFSPTAFSSREEVIAYVTAGRTSHKEQMAEIAGRLWDNGKIVQPRVDGGEMPTFPATKLWVQASSLRPTPQPREPLF